MTPLQFRKHLASALPEYNRSVDPDAPLDRWISYAVKVLRDGGIETYESCQGGPGHSFSEPTVRFSGGPAEGYRATAVALQHGLPIVAVRRFWRMLDGELEGPKWEMTFRAAELKRLQARAEAESMLS